MSCKPRRCCTVWLTFRDDRVLRGCPHCFHQFGAIPFEDAELGARQVQFSRDAHEAVCPRMRKPAADTAKRKPSVRKPNPRNSLRRSA